MAVQGGHPLAAHQQLFIFSSMNACMYACENVAAVGRCAVRQSEEIPVRGREVGGPGSSTEDGLSYRIIRCGLTDRKAFPSCSDSILMKSSLD